MHERASARHMSEIESCASLRTVPTAVDSRLLNATLLEVTGLGSRHPPGGAM
jgi:hypothetical protein